MFITLRNKKVTVEELMWNEVNVFLSETKLDEIFSKQQFKIHGYKLYWWCRNIHDGGGVIFTSVKILLVKLWALKKSSRWLRNNFDWTFHKNSKMAPIGLLKPPSQNDKYFLDNFQRISKHVNMGQSIQEWAKYIFLKTVFHKFYVVYSWILCPMKYYVDGRCQAHCWNENLEVFMGTFDLECMIKKPICFQSAHPNCTDLIVTNKKEFFENVDVLDVGISNHKSFINAALKNQFKLQFLSNGKF